MDNLFKKENFDTMITVRMTKKDRDKINEYAKSKGYKSTVDYIRQLIINDMNKENNM